MDGPGNAAYKILEWLGKAVPLTISLFAGLWLFGKFFLHDSRAIEDFIRSKSGLSEVTATVVGLAKSVEGLARMQNERKEAAEIDVARARAERQVLTNQVETLKAEIQNMRALVSDTSEIVRQMEVDGEQRNRSDPELRTAPVIFFNEDTSAYSVRGGASRTPGVVYIGEGAIITFSVLKPVSDLPDCGPPTHAAMWLKNGSDTSHALEFEGIQYLPERDFFQRIQKSIFIPSGDNIEPGRGVITYEIGYERCPLVPTQRSPEIHVQIARRAE